MTRHRWVRLLAVLFAAVVVLVSTPTTPASAAPRPAPSENDPKTLRDAREAAAKGHVEATNKLNNSKKRQQQLRKELLALNVQLESMRTQVGAVAVESYRTGRLSALSALLSSSDPDAFLDRAVSLEMMAQRDSNVLREMTVVFEQAEQTKAAIDVEVKEQQKQVQVLAKRKQDAERALASVGGNPAGGFVSTNSPLAKPAPRRADGSWPSESCTVDDPTTSGCITARTLHAMRQAQAAGFKRYVSCHRSSGGGEHPKGRACDFSAAAGGFENVSASGGDRTYGNNLAAFYVKNASRLGVMYVIWYRQIWMPGTGWRSYSGGGSPAADHTNHVHLSML